MSGRGSAGDGSEVLIYRRRKSAHRRRGVVGGMTIYRAEGAVHGKRKGSRPHRRAYGGIEHMTEHLHE